LIAVNRFLILKIKHNRTDAKTVTPEGTFPIAVLFAVIILGWTMVAVYN
jgi:hypothetical protein